jgi:hemoglobin-like flavoprotein
MTTITPLHRTLVQRSFRKIAGKTELVADLLYQHLFELSPSSKMLFNCEMRRQGRKLIQALAVAVTSLDKPDSLAPMLHDLGKRHIGYGARKQDYQHLGEALLYALEQTLGAEFTPELREAWTTVYRFLAETTTAAYDS